MAKIYVKINAQGCVVDIGSDVFLRNPSGWIMVDQGEGDRYVHAQNHYLDKTLQVRPQVYRYRLAEGVVTERSAEEIEADIAALPAPEPSEGELLNILLGGERV